MSKHNFSSSRTLTGFRHDRQQSERKKRLLWGFATIIILLFIFRTPVSGVLSSFADVILRPFYVAKTGAGDRIGSFSYLLHTKQTLADENARLRSSLDMIAAEAASRETLRMENEQMKAVLGRHSDRTFLLARVIASPGMSPYDTFIVDAGEKDGVVQGMKVFVDGDFMIGEVTRVFGSSAVITLYSSNGNEFSVTIGTSTIPVTAYGVGGGNFRVVLPKGVNITPGDIVEVPSFSPTYAGVIDAVNRPEGSSLQEVFFAWPGNMNALRFVYLEAADPAPEKAVTNKRP